MSEKAAIDLARATAHEAGTAAAGALAVAAANAAKKGTSTSEFKALVLGVLVTGGVAALHALSVIPSPVMPFAAAISAGLAVAAYSISRGQVKKAAIDGAAEVAASLLPGQRAAIETGRVIAGAIADAEKGHPPGGRL